MQRWGSARLPPPSVTFFPFLSQGVWIHSSVRMCPHFDLSYLLKSLSALPRYPSTKSKKNRERDSERTQHTTNDFSLEYVTPRPPLPACWRPAKPSIQNPAKPSIRNVLQFRHARHAPLGARLLCVPLLIHMAILRAPLIAPPKCYQICRAADSRSRRARQRIRLCAAAMPAPLQRHANVAQLISR